ncbi:MAG: hypothetical protein JWN84_3555 [Nocardioides sp.]|jgi:acyl-CoA thioester hydrolase|nr:hypothetical protein [Nocardioides sp.]
MSTTPAVAQVPLPTYAQAASLPSLVDGHVPEDFIDANGHMNIRHHIDLGATAADIVCHEIGVDDDYRSRRRLGVFTAEHHLRYLGELRLGDRFTAHTRVLDRSVTVAHLVSLVLDRTREQVACVMEIVLVHVDMGTRRPAPFPVDVIEGLDRWIAASVALPWPAPVIGRMGVRR